LKHISKTVWVLSLVSLFTDMASEMLYPIMPIYLKHIGFSIFIIGVLEGVVEAIAGLSKSYFGTLSDDKGKRVPFVQLGYALSALSKPMMAFFAYPIWVFFTRTVDRIGKGIRTGARDALLSGEATTDTKARVFGFHRSMDTLGAVLGPCIALLLLYLFPNNYKLIFLLAFIPGVLAIAATFFLKENNAPVLIKNKPTSFFSFICFWKSSSINYRKLVVGLLLFALINSSDIFLLLKAKDAGLSDVQVIGLYIFYNLVYAIAALPLGIVADKMGFKKILIFGFFIFALAYFLVGVSANISLLLFAFLLYGIYAAATEGLSKAWITNTVEKNNTGAAIGAYTAFQSIFSLFASTLAGFIWYKFGASTLFIFSAVGAVLVIVYFLVYVQTRK
jgi:MFS family permease